MLLLAALLALLLGAGSPGAPAAAANRPECAQALTPGDSQIEIQSGGVTRTATIHVPLARPGLRLPLLVALHGADQDASFFEPYTGFSQIADGEGFIALYPNAWGSKPFWKINDHDPRAPDDVAFISALLDKVEASYCVDLRRVYATGVSNGGGMASRIGCELASRFAAIAPIAGGYRSVPPCRPSAPVSVLEVHGTSDGAVPYYGSPPGHAGSVPRFLQDWIYHDHCASHGTRHREAAQVIQLDWAPCAAGTAVEHLEIVGGAHQLPGAMPPDTGPRSTVSVPWLVWSFLRSHQRAPRGAGAGKGVVAPAPAAAAAASAPAASAPAASAPAASPAGSQCSAAPTAGGQQIVVSVDGEQRSLWLHVPSAPAATRMPLLVAFHGFGGSGVEMERETGLSALADAQRFIVAYVDARGGRWGVRSSVRSEQDTDFTRAAIDYVQERYCVAAGRVFAVGVSNGGSEAVHVGCELSSLVSAVAIVAGDYRAATPCAPARPVSMLVLHGLNDTVVPYHGYDRQATGGVFGFLRLWLAFDRCAGASPHHSRLPSHMDKLTWLCPDSGTVVSHIKLFGFGHGWPGADPPPGTLPGANSASRLIWQFFARLPARFGAAATLAHR